MKRTKCEIWSRVVGYLRPVDNWNVGKQQEFKDRKIFKTKIEGGEIIMKKVEFVDDKAGNTKFWKDHPEEHRRMMKKREMHRKCMHEMKY